MSADLCTVLITGCSDGSLEAALALAFHERGLKIYATARNPNKMLSISAGGGHYQPFLHLDLNKARDLFETNVWGFLAVTQAFLPLLMEDASPPLNGKKTIIVNNTSISSVLRTPYHSAYGASKAAMAAFNDAQRIELQPFGVRVIDWKTGSTASNFAENRTNPLHLPGDSPYKPIEKEVENVIRGHATEQYAEDQTRWAQSVVADLLQKDPPDQVWRGGRAGLIHFTNATEGIIPNGLGDKGFQQLGGLDKLEKILIEKDKENH